MAEVASETQLPLRVEALQKWHALVHTELGAQLAGCGDLQQIFLSQGQVGPDRTVLIVQLAICIHRHQHVECIRTAGHKDHHDCLIGPRFVAGSTGDSRTLAHGLRVAVPVHS